MSHSDDTLWQPTTAPKATCALGTIGYLLAFAAVTLFLPREVLDPESRRFILIIGGIGIWRYSWGATHGLRALWYAFVRFPKLRAQADAMGRRGRPSQLFVIVASYQTEAAVAAPVYSALIADAIALGVPVTIVAAVSDPADEDLLQLLFQRFSPPPDLELVLMQQDGTGKRSALAEALRAVARRMPADDALVVLMDGDVRLPQGTLRRTTPFFAADPKLGALTTDNRGIVTGGNWVKEWFEMRFAQRHLMMCSMSVSKRVLVLTGRFSIFRADIATRTDFIDGIENDQLMHWRLGRIKFLTGDDKSTWFWLLKHKRPMIYVPDVQIHSFESLPTPSLIGSSVSLMKRWFGNMLRNNGRAVALGPRHVGAFTWWALVDQRISMWTSLTGPVFATLGAVAVDAVLLPTYLAWVMLTRFGQAAIAGGIRRRFSPYMPFLLYYSQVVGSFVKIAVSFRLNRQKWTRQGIGSGPTRPFSFQELVGHYLHALSFGVFVAFMAFGAGLLALPETQASWQIATGQSGREVDGDWIGKAVEHLPVGGTLHLPDGQFRLSQPLVITRDDIAIVGSSNGRTVLRASFAGRDSAVILVRGELPREVPASRCSALEREASADAREISLAAPLVARQGDFVSIRAANDLAFLADHGGTRWREQYPQVRQTLAEITGLGDNRVRVDRPIGFDFPVGSKACIVKLRQDVRLAQLSVIFDLGRAPNPSNYADDAPLHMVDGIAFIGAARPTLEAVEVINAGRHPLNIDTVLDLSGREIVLNGAHNKDSGNGYLRIARTVGARLTDLDVKDLRHITIQWSSHHNQITGLLSNTDVNFHGGLSHHNTVVADELAPRPDHPWQSVFRTPDDARWAPPDGVGNRVVDANGTSLEGPAIRSAGGR